MRGGAWDPFEALFLAVLSAFALHSGLGCLSPRRGWCRFCLIVGKSSAAVTGWTGCVAHPCHLYLASPKTLRLGEI